MGRGKVDLKRVDNKIHGQVTFSKRRNGLLKKAYKLSVLCDAEVALIIFSNREKLYEFCSGSSTTRTLEKYQKCSYGALETNCSVLEMQNNYRECLKLKARVEVPQKCQRRNLLGEDLAPLDSKELEQPEHQLEISQKQVRSQPRRKCCLKLAKLSGGGGTRSTPRQGSRFRLTWEGGDQQNDFSYSRTTSHPHVQSEGFLQPLATNSALQIGYSPIGEDVVGVGAATDHDVNGFVPGWML